MAFKATQATRDWKSQGTLFRRRENNRIIREWRGHGGIQDSSGKKDRKKGKKKGEGNELNPRVLPNNG
jgi:hypothetical protein